jgi:hypothetical protein
VVSPPPIRRGRSKPSESKWPPFGRPFLLESATAPGAGRRSPDSSVRWKRESHQHIRSAGRWGCHAAMKGERFARSQRGRIRGDGPRIEFDSGGVAPSESQRRHRDRGMRIALDPAFHDQDGDAVLPLDPGVQAGKDEAAQIDRQAGMPIPAARGRSRPAREARRRRPPVASRRAPAGSVAAPARRAPGRRGELSTRRCQVPRAAESLRWRR